MEGKLENIIEYFPMNYNGTCSYWMVCGRPKLADAAKE